MRTRARWLSIDGSPHADLQVVSVEDTGDPDVVAVHGWLHPVAEPAPEWVVVKMRRSELARLLEAV